MQYYLISNTIVLRSRNYCCGHWNFCFLRHNLLFIVPWIPAIVYKLPDAKDYYDN